jgi:hypothetical protein
MTLFQRAESSAFFGREIGVMYMHAHLRWAETLAHLGLADKFFAALALAHPIALRERVPSASLRQANCYFSSSDAAFADRYDAQEHYARVASGEVPLDGGWRVYSSGPGIAIGLIVGSFLGVRRRHARWCWTRSCPVPCAACRRRWNWRGTRCRSTTTWAHRAAARVAGTGRCAAALCARLPTPTAAAVRNWI